LGRVPRILVSAKKKRDEAINLLRIVGPEKSFRFYRGIGQPLGVSSSSLAEFGTVVRGIDATSVSFHVERGDFENWFRMLGDEGLADKVSAMRGKKIPPGEMRGTVSSLVSERVARLQRAAKPK